jgi:hypothetical protein
LKRYFKYGICLIIALAIAHICFTCQSCGEVGQTSRVAKTPDDTNFAKIVERDYRPASTPFEHPLEPDVRLPQGYSEKEVKRVIIVTKSIDVSDRKPVFDKTAIIEMRSGEIFVDKQGGRVQSTEVVTYKDPIFSLGLYPQVGTTIGKGFSPMIGFSPLRILGRVDFPLLATDLQGVGVGVSGKIWHNFSAGLLAHWSFTIERQVKFLASYTF